jgi:hypothetical protein
MAPYTFFYLEMSKILISKQPSIQFIRGQNMNILSFANYIFRQKVGLRKSAGDMSLVLIRFSPLLYENLIDLDKKVTQYVIKLR